MDQWDFILETYRGQSAHPEQTQGMIDLVEHLRTLPEFEGLQAGLAGLALALGWPEIRRRVHVAWVRPWTYAVFLDFCADTFYGERVEVEIERVVQTIVDYLQRLRE